jgi:hypothetical protein
VHSGVRWREGDAHYWNHVALRAETGMPGGPLRINRYAVRSSVQKPARLAAPVQKPVRLAALRAQTGTLGDPP